MNEFLHVYLKLECKSDIEVDREKIIQEAFLSVFFPLLDSFHGKKVLYKKSQAVLSFPSSEEGLFWIDKICFLLDELKKETEKYTLEPVFLFLFSNLSSLSDEDKKKFSSLSKSLTLPGIYSLQKPSHPRLLILSVLELEELVYSVEILKEVSPKKEKLRFYTPLIFFSLLVVTLVVVFIKALIPWLGDSVDRRNIQDVRSAINQKKPLSVIYEKLSTLEASSSDEIESLFRLFFTVHLDQILKIQKESWPREEERIRKLKKKFSDSQGLLFYSDLLLYLKNPEGATSLYTKLLGQAKEEVSLQFLLLQTILFLQKDPWDILNLIDTSFAQAWESEQEILGSSLHVVLLNPLGGKVKILIQWALNYPWILDQLSLWLEDPNMQIRRNSFEILVATGDISLRQILAYLKNANEEKDLQLLLALPSKWPQKDRLIQFLQEQEADFRRKGNTKKADHLLIFLQKVNH